MMLVQTPIGFAALFFFSLCNNLINRVSSSTHRELQNEGNPLAEAYVCNSVLDEIPSNDPILFGDSVRICIKTHLRARMEGISIAKVASFALLKEGKDHSDIEQILIHDGIEENFGTKLVCQPGSVLCYFDAQPDEDFFGSDGYVSAIGKIVMQYGSRQSDFEPSSLRGSSRNLLDPMMLLDELETVEVKFLVGDGLDGSSRIGRKVREFWSESPDYAKGLYILAIISLLGSTCAIFYYWSKWSSSQRVKDNEKRSADEETKPNLPSGDDQSGTFVGDDESHNSKPKISPRPKQVYVKRSERKLRESAKKEDSEIGSQGPSPQVKRRSWQMDEATYQDDITNRKRKPRKPPSVKVNRVPSSAPGRKSRPKPSFTGPTGNVVGVVGDHPRTKAISESPIKPKPASMRWMEEKKRGNGKMDSPTTNTSRTAAVPSQHKSNMKKRSERRDSHIKSELPSKRKVRFSTLSREEAHRRQNPRVVD